MGEVKLDLKDLVVAKGDVGTIKEFADIFRPPIDPDRIRREVAELADLEVGVASRAKLARGALAGAVSIPVSTLLPGVSPQVLQAYVDELVGAASETLVELAPGVDRRTLAALALSGQIELGQVEKVVRHITPAHMEHVLVPLEGQRVAAFRAELDAARARMAAHSAKGGGNSGGSAKRAAGWLSRLFNAL